jgi:hypothetical protein
MQEITITTEEIIKAWDGVQAKGGASLPKGAETLSRYADGAWKGSKVDKWIGASGEQIQGWLHNGYYAEESTVQLGQGQEEISVPFIDFNESEGEWMYEQRYEDLPFMVWENFEAKRGIKIRACFDFNAGVDSDTIIRYFDWVLGLVDAAERQGISPEVELFIETEGSFAGKDSARHRCVIPVVQAGRINDAVAWRAFLSNGGFRSLGFLCLGIAASKLGERLVGSLGRAVGQKWTAEHKDEVLTIHANGNASSFPQDTMDKLVEGLFE